jgi:hypothetical protein
MAFVEIKAAIAKNCPENTLFRFHHSIGDTLNQHTSEISRITNCFYAQNAQKHAI